jgi:hypothetical protein
MHCFRLIMPRAQQLLVPFLLRSCSAMHNSSVTWYLDPHYTRQDCAVCTTHTVIHDAQQSDLISQSSNPAISKIFPRSALRVRLMSRCEAYDSQTNGVEQRAGREFAELFDDVNFGPQLSH